MVIVDHMYMYLPFANQINIRCSTLTTHLVKTQIGYNSHVVRYLLRPNWGRISPLSRFKKEQKLLKMVYIIQNFLVLHFGENFMKI